MILALRFVITEQAVVHFSPANHVLYSYLFTLLHLYKKYRITKKVERLITNSGSNIEPSHMWNLN